MDLQKAREAVRERRALASALDGTPQTTERAIRQLREAVALLLRESADRLSERIGEEENARGTGAPSDRS